MRRVASTRFGFQIFKYTTFGSVISFGGCAMMAGGGLHGLAVGGAFGAALGAFIGTVAILAGAAHDSSRAVREAMGHNVLSAHVVQKEEGQLSVATRDPRGDLAVSAGATPDRDHG